VTNDEFSQLLLSLYRPWWWWLNPWGYTYQLEQHIVKLVKELRKQNVMLNDLY
jgi:hypothetical protein